MVSIAKTYQQLVMDEIKAMQEDRKPIRVSFAPETDPHRHLTVLSSAMGITERKIIEAAIRVFFTTYIRSINNDKSTTE